MALDGDPAAASTLEADSNLFINPEIRPYFDNTNIRQDALLSRTSRQSANQAKVQFLMAANDRLNVIWNRICFYPRLNQQIPNLGLWTSGTSRVFMKGLRGTVKAIKKVFSTEGSALILGGVDGLTTDIKDLLEFLDSTEHTHEVQLFWIEEGDL